MDPRFADQLLQQLQEVHGLYHDRHGWLYNFTFTRRQRKLLATLRSK